MGEEVKCYFQTLPIAVALWDNVARVETLFTKPVQTLLWRRQCLPYARAFSSTCRLVFLVCFPAPSEHCWCHKLVQQCSLQSQSQSQGWQSVELGSPIPAPPSTANMTMPATIELLEMLVQAENHRARCRPKCCCRLSTEPKPILSWLKPNTKPSFSIHFHLDIPQLSHFGRKRMKFYSAVLLQMKGHVRLKFSKHDSGWLVMFDGLCLLI